MHQVFPSVCWHDLLHVKLWDVLQANLRNPVAFSLQCQRINGNESVTMHTYKEAIIVHKQK